MTQGADLGGLSSDQGFHLKLLYSDLAIYGWVSTMLNQLKNYVRSSLFL